MSVHYGHDDSMRSAKTSGGKGRQSNGTVHEERAKDAKRDGLCCRHLCNEHIDWVLGRNAGTPFAAILFESSTFG